MDYLIAILFLLCVLAVILEIVLTHNHQRMSEDEAKKPEPTEEPKPEEPTEPKA